MQNPTLTKPKRWAWGEFLVALLVVPTICYLLLTAAEWRAAQPIRENHQGVIELIPYRAEITGTAKLYPMTLEEQKADFGYHFGQEIHAERLGRKLGPWPKDATATWRFRTNKPAYELTLEYATEPDGGGDCEITIGQQTLPVSLQPTAGPEDWRTQVVGIIKLPAGPATLTIKPTRLAKDSLMHLNRVALSPAK